jgi:hypothetical protein
LKTGFNCDDELLLGTIAVELLLGTIAVELLLDTIAVELLEEPPEEISTIS